MLNFIKKEKISAFFAICICVLSVVVCIARYFPTNVGSVYQMDAEPIIKLEKSDIVVENNCQVNEDGSYEILDSDPQLVFSLDGKNIQALKLNLASPVKTGVDFEVYTATQTEGFTAEKRYIGNVFMDDTSAIISLPKGDYNMVRVDINGQDGVIFKNVELFDEQPSLVPYTPKRSVKDYVLTIIIPLICTVCAFFANKYLKICETVAGVFKRNYKTILMFTTLSVAAVPVSAFMEWVLCKVERQGVFSPYRWLFFFGVLEIAIAFILLKKYLAQKPENVFLPTVLIIGFVMMFGSPIKHICWDFDSHYPWAVHTSYSDTTYITGSYMSIDYVESHTLFDRNTFNLENYEKDLEALSAADERLVKVAPSQFSIAHLPAGLVIAVARMFGAGFVVRYTLGRMTYLLMYAFVCYFAIRKIKSGKMILATICLLPTGIFLATNYAYDCCVTAFMMLGTAYFVSEIQQPDKPITLKDTIIMGCAFAIGAWSKLVYIVLMGMTLFMRKNWKGKAERRKYYLIIISIFALMFCYFALTTLIKTGQGGDTRGGNVDPIAQIKFILHNPIDYAKILIKFLRGYLSIRGAEQYISNFAYFGYGKWWPVFVMLLGFTAITDASGEAKFKIPVWMKVLSVALFLGMAALIATALFINFTPVGSQTIEGCQSRYLIPLLAPLLLLVAGQRKDIIKEKDAYNGLVLLAASSATMMDLYTVIITKMV